MPDNPYIDQVNVTIVDSSQRYDVHARAYGTSENLTSISEVGEVVDSGLAKYDVKQNMVDYNGYEDIYSKLHIEGGQDNTKLGYVLNNLTDRAIDYLNRIENLEYGKIDINSFTASPATADIGSTVNTVTLSWVITPAGKDPARQEVSGELITPNSVRSITKSNISSSTSWILRVTDERDITVERTCSISFLNRAYWGVSANTSYYDSSFIINLPNNGGSSVLTNTKNRTINLNAGPSNYIFYAIPHSFGSPTFTVGGFSGGFTKVVDNMRFTNSYNYTNYYDIWKSDNDNLGDLTIVIT